MLEDNQAKNVRSKVNIPKLLNPIRFALVGGGDASFMGDVHRTIARLDGLWELSAGAFSSDPQKSKQFGLELGLSKGRCYGSWQELLEKESRMDPRIKSQAIIVITPNNTHYEIASEAMKAGFHVLLEKPATRTVQEALRLRDDFQKALETYPNIQFGLTHNYVGNTMVMLMRYIIGNGLIGDITSWRGSYLQSWLIDLIEGENKQAKWRTNKDIAGSGALGDIGSHLYHIFRFLMPKMRITKILADLSTFVEGRGVEDHGSILVHTKCGSRGNLEISQVAAGHANDLKIEINGTLGSLSWRQEDPGNLFWSHKNGNTERISAGKGMPSLPPEIDAMCRLPGGHPEGYFEAYGNLYRIFAWQIAAADGIIGFPKELEAFRVPDINCAAQEMVFIASCLDSASGGHWSVAHWILED